MLELSPDRARLYFRSVLPALSKNMNKVVRERMVCHAFVGNQNGKECIMTVHITCQFIAPILNISPQQQQFCVEKVCMLKLV
ncbi:hydrocephalus-inducing protein homolog isoform X1, partial [Tachysurus ichikawai]